MKKVKKGQIWKAKQTGFLLEILSKATGNRHWNAHKVGKKGDAHKIHEGTLEKFYELIT